MTYVEPSESDMVMATKLLLMSDKYEGITPFWLASIIVKICMEERERLVKICDDNNMVKTTIKHSVAAIDVIRKNMTPN